jgi:D-3-phosphoglycerate dehydrogenase
MAVEELMNYIENGNIVNSVNYPACNLGVCQTTGRVAICHQNVPSVISKLTAVLGEAGINIEEMANKSKGDFAYSLLDIEKSADDAVVEKLASITGVIKVRVVK